MTIYRHDDYRESDLFHADVLVIGTGAGGASSGAQLAEAGVDVLFVEEGSYHPTSSFSPYATESIPRLYRDAGACAILGSPMIYYAEGRCVGGTTVLNGGMTYRPPERVLDEWEKVTGCSDLGVAGMTPLLEQVESDIHAAHQHPASVGNDSRVMEAAAKKLGWKVEVNKRNQEACVGSNNCILGCPTGAKQSTLVSYMPRAMKAGARCLTEVRIVKLIIENGRCVGAIGKAIDPRTMRSTRRVTIRASAVVVSCGAIQTPYLLQRHRRIGRRSGQLGKNFLCHPNAKVLALYPGEVNAWQGVSQYCQVREFHDEGILFAENFIPPAMLSLTMPVMGDEVGELMAKYNHMVASGVLVEDSITGTVSRGVFGGALPRYQITAGDFERFKRGVRLLAMMHYEMGAEQVLLPLHVNPITRSMDEVDAVLANASMSELELFTVHLMGTARMGGDAHSSVVDTWGECWELPGCYVADASLFPTAIGVNPQVTIMALATRIARKLAEKVLHERVGNGSIRKSSVTPLGAQEALREHA